MLPVTLSFLVMADEMLPLGGLKTADAGGMSSLKKSVDETPGGSETTDVRRRVKTPIANATLRGSSTYLKPP
jgi:hypothetical protein